MISERCIFPHDSFVFGISLNPVYNVMLVFRTPNVAKKTSDVESDDNSNDNDWTYNGSRKCTLRYVILVSGQLTVVVLVCVCLPVCLSVCHSKAVCLICCS